MYGMARGTMSQVMVYAAAYNQDIKRVFLVNPLSSYRSVVTHRYYEPEYIYSAVGGALKSFDLPDLAGSLAPRKLTMVNVVSGTSQEDDLNTIDEDMSVIQSAYKRRNSEKEHQIIRNNTNDITEILSDWSNGK